MSLHCAPFCFAFLLLYFPCFGILRSCQSCIVPVIQSPWGELAGPVCVPDSISIIRFVEVLVGVSFSVLPGLLVFVTLWFWEMTVMLSSQGIGLITVIAVSGCSVMLMVLGRQKLLELKKDCSCLQDKVNQEGALGSHSCEHHQEQHAEVGASISWRMNSGKMDYANLCSKVLWKSAPTAVNGSRSDKKRNLVKKKVRFSEDVVEPSGDNVAYRRRHALAFTARQPRSQEPHKTGCQNKRINYSKSDANQRRVLANIPPNRMALYVGICNDRSQRRLLHWSQCPFPNSPISFVRQAEKLFRDPMVQDQGICFVYDVSLLTGRADYEVLRLVF